MKKLSGFKWSLKHKVLAGHLVLPTVCHNAGVQRFSECLSLRTRLWKGETGGISVANHSQTSTSMPGTRTDHWVFLHNTCHGFLARATCHCYTQCPGQTWATISALYYIQSPDLIPKAPEARAGQSWIFKFSLLFQSKHSLSALLFEVGSIWFSTKQVKT